MEKDDEEYKKELWEFFASKGGVPKQFGMFAAQGWYIRKENEFRKLKGLEPLRSTLMFTEPPR